MSEARVSVIIATYNRPEVLKKSIASVLLQTYTNWVIHVIGDDCSPSTGEVLKEFSDPRIRYYNNPFRFGEQSGGNSIGVALANTPYIAYLNHDDLWAPTHLEAAVSVLSKGKNDFYVGRSVISRGNVNGFPEFKEVSHRDRKPYWTFFAHPVNFEPCSSWVLSTSFAKKLGYWKQAVQIYRTPLQEYVMRAWHKKARFHFGHTITCIKLNQHQTTLNTKHQYDYIGEEHDLVLRLFKEAPQQFESLIREDALVAHPHAKFKPFEGEHWKVKTLYHLYFNIITAYAYYFTGIDMYEVFCKKMKQQKGAALLFALKNRTGESELKMQSLYQVIQHAIDHRI
jgi:glycosyltransferase involved in cell wall biosynthesis